jgi:hypothetical protein
MKSRAMMIIVPAALMLIAAFNAAGQEKPADNTSKPGKETLGPVAESIRPYRPTNRDPFKRSVKPKGPRAKSATPRAMGFPALDARRAEFRQKTQQAESMGRPAPDPVSQYLVNEVDITGVFRDDRGFGAFVRAQPSGTMFFVRNGSRLYNGEVTRIMPDEGDGSARVQFREISYIEVNGKQSPQERVVIKVPSAVRR